MKYVQNRYSKLFESAWNNYLKMNPSDIIMTGKKTDRMEQVPIYRLTGAFSGWVENDTKKDIITEMDTTVKIKVKDLMSCWSQPGVMPGSGFQENIQENKNIYIDDEVLLFENIQVNKVCEISLEYDIIDNPITKKIVSFYNEHNQIYKQIQINKSGKGIISFKFNSSGTSIFMNSSMGTPGMTTSNFKIGNLNGAIKCPIDNIKSNIDTLTVSNRSFKIDGQKLSASNVLMVLTLSNKG